MKANGATDGIDGHVHGMNGPLHVEECDNGKEFIA